MFTGVSDLFGKIQCIGSRLLLFDFDIQIIDDHVVRCCTWFILFDLWLGGYWSSGFIDPGFRCWPCVWYWPVRDPGKLSGSVILFSLENVWSDIFVRSWYRSHIDRCTWGMVLLFWILHVYIFFVVDIFQLFVSNCLPCFVLRLGSPLIVIQRLAKHWRIRFHSQLLLRLIIISFCRCLLFVFSSPLWDRFLSFSFSFREFDFGRRSC